MPPWSTSHRLIFVKAVLLPRVHILSCKGQCWLLLCLKFLCHAGPNMHPAGCLFCLQFFWLHLAAMKFLQQALRVDCCFYFPPLELCHRHSHEGFWMPLKPKYTEAMLHGMPRCLIFFFLQNIVENATTSAMCNAKCCHYCMLIVVAFTFLNGTLPKVSKHCGMGPFLPWMSLDTIALQHFTVMHNAPMMPHWARLNVDATAGCLFLFFAAMRVTHGVQCWCCHHMGWLLFFILFYLHTRCHCLLCFFWQCSTMLKNIWWQCWLLLFLTFLMLHQTALQMTVNPAMQHSTPCLIC